MLAPPKKLQLEFYKVVPIAIANTLVKREVNKERSSAILLKHRHGKIKWPSTRSTVLLERRVPSLVLHMTRIVRLQARGTVNGII
jgi:hypothetical protein